MSKVLSESIEEWIVELPSLPESTDSINELKTHLEKEEHTMTNALQNTGIDIVDASCEQGPQSDPSKVTILSRAWINTILRVDATPELAQKLRELGYVVDKPRGIVLEQQAVEELERITPSNAELLELAKDNPPPQKWYDEPQEQSSS